MNDTKDPDEKLLEIVAKRLNNYNPTTLLSEKEVNICLNIADKDLVDFETVEIE